MTDEYYKISWMKLLLADQPAEDIRDIPGVIYDAQSLNYYVLKDSPTYTWLALKFPRLFQTVVQEEHYPDRIQEVVAYTRSQAK